MNNCKNQDVCMWLTHRLKDEIRTDLVRRWTQYIVISDVVEQMSLKTNDIVSGRCNKLWCFDKERDEYFFNQKKAYESLQG